jgi:hypothetical protein
VDGWKVAGWASRSSVLYSERNNCFRRIGNEEIFTTYLLPFLFHSLFPLVHAPFSTPHFALASAPDQATYTRIPSLIHLISCPYLLFIYLTFSPIHTTTFVLAPPPSIPLFRRIRTKTLYVQATVACRLPRNINSHAPSSGRISHGRSM